MTENPLVSICVFTYNSGEYIIEALDSVASQTYDNIEIIVSDDASKDSTVELCNNWLSAHGARFVHTELVTVAQNTGVTANANRALNKCQGEWIKYFAGDDKLLPNCIEDNLSYVKAHPETKLLFSDLLCFRSNHTGTEISSRKVYFKYLSPREFKVRFLVQNFLPAPSTFLRKDLFESMGGFDESIPMMEDKPFYIKVLFSDAKMDYMPKPTVCYRIGEQSVSQGNNKNTRFRESQEKASSLILEKLKSISLLLWIYKKNEYQYQFHPSFRNKIRCMLRYINPAYYYVQYLFLKIRILSHG